MQARHPKLFKGLGKLGGKYHIQLKDNAVPYAVNTPRRIALPLMPKAKDKLVELERQGVISKVDQPTDWCAPIVAVPKSNGDVRVCVDLTKLNDQVKRERLMLPSVDDVLSQLSESLFEVRCELWLLSDRAYTGIGSVDNLHHPVWAVLL